MISQLSTFLKFANLQMAAEALYELLPNGAAPGATYRGNIKLADLTVGNNHVSKFPSTLAAEFAGNWEVVEHISNTATGFSGTLFRARRNNPDAGIVEGELVLSCRSTEFIDDAARDNRATNTMEISRHGWAYGQIADMRRWFDHLDQDPGLLGGRRFSITGYSLGGHLATALNMILSERSQHDRINETFTFNGAGVGEIKAGWSLNGLIDRFERLRTNASGVEFQFGDSLVQELYVELAAILNHPDKAPTRAELQAAKQRIISSAAPHYMLHPLAAAVGRIEEVLDEIDSLAHISPLPAQISADHVAATRLDYQLAVFNVSQLTSSTNVVTAPWNRRADPTGFNRFHDVFGATWPSSVANSQIHFGISAPVYVEDQPIWRGTYPGDAALSSFQAFDIKLLVSDYEHNDMGDTHSLVLLVDSLAMLDVLQRLAPDASQSQLEALLKASTASHKYTDAPTQGKAEGDTLETVVDALSKILLGADPELRKAPGLNSGNTWHDFRVEGRPDNLAHRENFHARLALLRQLIANNPSTYELISLAGGSLDPRLTSGTEAHQIAYRYALLELNPFVVLGADYSRFNQQGALALFDPATGEGEITPEWIEDREALLASILSVNRLNKDPISESGGVRTYTLAHTGRQRLITDVDNGVAVQELAIFATDEGSIRFGGSRDDTLAVVQGPGRMYGMAGNDVLTGGEQSDHIEGGSGNDRIDGGGGDDSLLGGIGNDDISGGAGNDTLLGGLGDDILRGGDGVDDFILIAGQGNDTIIDTDGKGRVFFGPDMDHLQQLSGYFKRDAQNSNVWHSAGDGGWDLVHGATWQLVKADSTVIDLGTDFEHKDLALWLETEVPAVPNRHLLTEARDSLDLDYAGLRYGAEIQAYGGDDYLFASFWPDVVDAGDGNDWIVPSFADVDDPVWGSARWSGVDLTGFEIGKDVVRAGAGDDLISQIGPDAQVWGGDGRDIIRADRQIYITGGYESEMQALAGWNRDRTLWTDAEGLILLKVGPQMPTSYAGPAVTAAGNITMNLDPAESGALRGTATLTLDGETQGQTVDVSYHDHEIPESYWIGKSYPGVRLLGEAGDDDISGSPGDDFISGGGDNDYLFGKFGNDQIEGGSGDDVLAGGKGGDLLDGGEGVDRVFGELGNDTIVGGAGADSVRGGEGADRVDAGSENDWVAGGLEEDTIFGGAGDDQLWGGKGEAFPGAPDDGADSIDGGAGNDQIVGEGGNDTLLGGSDNDSIWGDAGSDVIEGGAGADQLYGDAGDDLLEGGEGIDELRGGAGNDTLVGGGGRDALQGGEGDDTYLFGVGDAAVVDGIAETVDDQLGVNRLVLSGVSSLESIDSTDSGGNLTISVGGAQAIYAFGGFAGGISSVVAEGREITIAEFRAATLSHSVSTTVITSNGTLAGGRMADTLTARGGSNTLMGGRGNDTLIGGGGGNTYSFALGDGADRIEDRGNVRNADGSLRANRVRFGEGIGPDDLQLAFEQSKLMVKVGPIDSIELPLVNYTALLTTPAIDEFVFADGSTMNWAQLVAKGVRVEGGAGWESLLGTDQTDTLRGGQGNDALYGMGGSDTYRFEIGDGRDTVYASGSGAGVLNLIEFGADISADTIQLAGLSDGRLLIYYGGPSDELGIADYFVGDDAGPRTWALRFADGSTLGRTEIAQRLARGTPGDDNLRGGSGNDTINAGAGNDKLSGFGGGDLLDGGVGNDTLLGGDGEDSANGAEGIDQIYGGGGNDRLDGGLGDDRLYGEDANDLLHGGAGNDSLVGGAGDDRLDGGAGSDHLESGSGRDTLVVGFDTGQDDINFGISVTTPDLDDIEFGPGVVPEDLDLAGDRLSIRGSDARLWLTPLYDERQQYRIGSVRFADGRAMAWDEFRAAASTGEWHGGDAADSMVLADARHLTLFGHAGNDTLTGRGAGLVSGGEGDDVLELGILLPGSGPASGSARGASGTLIGGAGSDTFRVDLEASTILSGRDTLAANVDRVVLARPLDRANLHFEADAGGNLHIYARPPQQATNGGEPVLLIENFFTAGAEGHTIDELVFADGERWSWQQLRDTALNALGTARSDVVSASAGDDSIDGRGGNDTICGEAGADLLDGGDGDDDLQGGAGNDSLRGGVGDDVLKGYTNGRATADGDDSLWGGAGRDSLYGGDGSDVYRFLVGDGKDYISDSAGVNTLELGPGLTSTSLSLLRETDRYSGRERLVLWFAASGDELTIEGIPGSTGNRFSVDRIRFDGGAGGEWALADLVARTPAATAVDTLLGSSGNDQFIVEHTRDQIVESSGGGYDIALAGVDYQLPQYVEELRLGGNRPLSASGNSGSNRIVGNAGDNLLMGDSLTGGNTPTQSDTLVGGLGDDVYRISGGGQNFTLVELANEGSDWVDLTGAFTGPNFGQATNSYHFTLPAHIENLRMGSGPEIIGAWRRATGNALDNILVGDTLRATLFDGVSGADTFEGGRGDDIFIVNSLDDVVRDASTRDRDEVRSSVAFRLGEGLENLSLLGSEAIEGNGNSLDNVLDGSQNLAANRLAGAAGDDRYVVGIGDQIIELAEGGRDTVVIAAGAAGEYSVDAFMNVENIELGDALAGSSLIGDAQANRLRGNASANLLEADAGSDTIYGGSGNDLLRGGSGDDLLDGGSGMDYFAQSGADWLEGGEGDDWLTVQDAGVADTLLGGTGNDVYVISGLGVHQCVEFAGEGIDEIRSQDDLAEFVLPNQVEHLTALSVATLSGNALDNRLDAGNGNNRLAGGAGNDTLNAGGGDDTLDGGAGNDLLVGGAGADTYLFGVGSGEDTIVNHDTDPAGALPDRILIGGGLTAADLSIGRAGDDLLLTLAGGEVLRVSGYLAQGGVTRHQVDELHFASGGSLSSAEIISRATDPDRPWLARPQPDLALAVDRPFALDLPADMFRDPNPGDSLTLSASLADGSALPAWLAFDAAARRFAGNPPAEALGAVTIRLVATDGTGRFAADEFVLDVSVANAAPTLTQPLADQSAAGELAFSLALPEASFSDPDFGDTLSYSATLADGSGLPSWLAFDAATRSFSGAPRNSDAGLYQITVTATDSGGLNVSDDFQLTVSETNLAPQLVQPLPDQALSAESPWSWSIPAECFADANPGDLLVYSATRADGSALPGWLAFDAATRSFSGTAANADAGVLSLRVTTTDPEGLWASDDFELQVLPVNHAPQLGSALPDQSARAGNAFSFTIPAASFSDPDAGDALSYSASRVGGGALPAWLAFDPLTRQFTGTPLAGDVGSLSLTVTATDSGGLSAADSFDIVVAAAEPATIKLRPVEDRFAIISNAFSFTLPATSFVSTVAGDTLSYSARLASGAALPSWLKFDAASRSFSGTPASTAQGSLALRISVTSATGLSASDDFYINVANRQAGTSSANKLTGTSLPNYLVGLGGNDTLYARAGNDWAEGGTGNDSIFGEAGDDRLDGGAGSDTVTGGAGSDTYVFGRGSQSDTIDDYATDLASTDVLSFGADVASEQIWLSRSGSNLQLRIIGTADVVTVRNWYSGEAYHVDEFRTADGRVLLDSQVDALVSAMAAFAPPASGQTTLPPNYQSALSGVIAANWSSAA